MVEVRVLAAWTQRASVHVGLLIPLNVQARRITVFARLGGNSCYGKEENEKLSSLLRIQQLGVSA